MENVIVRDSPIHGRGMFATRRIDAGEVILDWSGCSEVLSDGAVNALPSEERIFVSVIDGQNILFRPPARFINHSCNPNARGRDRHDIAIRVIDAGEEVTVDYVAEQVPGLRLECNCKEPNCRGLLIVPSGPNSECRNADGPIERNLRFGGLVRLVKAIRIRRFLRNSYPLHAWNRRKAGNASLNLFDRITHLRTAQSGLGRGEP